MDKRILRVLLVEDDEDDFLLLRGLLAQSTIFDCETERAATYRAAKRAIAEKTFDACLIDYCLGEQTGLELLREATAEGFRAPMILLTGNDDREVDLEAMTAGAADYLVKGKLEAAVLERAIRYALEQKRAEAVLSEAAKRQFTLIENAPDVICTVNAEGRFVKINPACFKMWGYYPAELVGRKYIHLVVPEDVEKTNKVMERVLSGERVTDFENCYRHRDGTHVTVVWTAYWSESERLIFAVARDVTRRRQAEEALEKERTFLSAVLENMSDGLVACDAEGELTLFNRAAQQFHGLSAEPIPAERWAEYYDLYQADGSTPMSKEQIPLFRALQGETVSNAEIVIAPKNKKPLTLIASGQPIFNQQGRKIGAVVGMRDITERKRAEQALRQAEARYRSLVELSPAIVYLAEPFPPYPPIYISPNIEMFGYQSDEWFSREDMWLRLIHEEDRARVLRETENAMNRGFDTEIEYRIIGRNGEIYWVHDKGRFISDEAGNKIAWQGVILDITETKKLEDQLGQAQKLESVGRLAGGIAHDFNNVLTVINGYGDLALMRLGEEDERLRKYIEEIKKAGERSASLTHQLLAFSRKQVLKPKVLEPNQIVTETSMMLKRLIGEDIRFKTVLDPELGRVEVDPGQLTQVIINLAVNARDAMPQGGELVIKTENAYLDAEYAARHVSAEPGSYVMLSVSDNGLGMDEETRQCIFDPFFTTKETGKGTGLGLATVYGIIKQSGGFIWVYSQLGSGSVFKIYLPRVDKPASHYSGVSPEKAPSGTETILLVEDEEMVRNLTRQILETCGYKVIEARNGAEALVIFQQSDTKIDLLITDVVMPIMGGRELAEKVTQLRPQTRLLYTSGYTDDAIIREGVIEIGENFIQKPFTFDSLARKVRRLLDEEPKERL